MRFYEGDHAREIERVLDPATQLHTPGGRYKVHRIRPIHELLRGGEVSTPRGSRKGRETSVRLGNKRREQGEAGREQARSLSAGQQNGQKLRRPQ